MMRIFITSMAFLALFAASQATGQLLWETHELAVASPADAPKVTAAFSFRNVGQTPIAVRSVKSDCDCATAALEKQVFRSGEEGKVVVTFTVGQRRGLQVKRLVVHSDYEDDSEQTLTLKVNLLPDPKAVAAPSGKTLHEIRDTARQLSDPGAWLPTNWRDLSPSDLAGLAQMLRISDATAQAAFREVTTHMRKKLLAEETVGELSMDILIRVASACAPHLNPTERTRVLQRTSQWCESQKHNQALAAAPMCELLELWTMIDVLTDNISDLALDGIDAISKEQHPTPAQLVAQLQAVSRMSSKRAGATRLRLAERARRLFLADSVSLARIRPHEFKELITQIASSLDAAQRQHLAGLLTRTSDLDLFDELGLTDWLTLLKQIDSTEEQIIELGIRSLSRARSKPAIPSGAQDLRAAEFAPFHQYVNAVKDRQRLLDDLTAALADSRGALRLSVAKALTVLYFAIGRSDTWTDRIDKILSDAKVTGDLRARWILTRAYCDEVKANHRSPTPLVAKAWIDQAIATAESEGQKLQSLHWLISRYAAGGHFEIAWTTAKQFQPHIESTISQQEILGWKRELALRFAETERRQSELDRAAHTAWSQEIARRLDAARARGDTEEADRLQRITKQQAKVEQAQ